MIYILSKSNLAIKDAINVSNYSIEKNINLKGRMTFTLHRMPIAEKDDLIKYDDVVGIITSINSTKSSNSYTIQVTDIHALFARDIILTSEALIASTGIEDFIAQVIYDRFTDSSDALLNISFLDVLVSSHTTLNISVGTNNGIYNFMSFLAFAKLTYSIDLSFSITGQTLYCVIKKNDDIEKEIDLTISDIISYDTVFSIDVISKVTVYSVETSTEFNYFLLTDGTMTTSSSDPNRVVGKVTTVYVQTDSEALQKAIDTFKENTFKHNISFTLVSDSKNYEKELFYLNKPIRVKTSENGIFSTFISKVTTSMKSNVIQVECGNTKIGLIDILKGAL